MRAVRTVDGEARLIQVDEPADVEGGVRIDVAASGICGSDLHLLAMNLPVTLGHEYAGRTPDGQAVAIQPLHYCGNCEPCRAGRTNLCVHIHGVTHGVGVDGGMADQAIVHPDCLVPLPETLSLSDASLVEPLAVALHGVHRLGAVAGGRALVIGGGPIGLMSVVAAQSVGLEVDIAARHPHQIEAAETLGAGTEVGRDYDAVIEAAGSESALADAFHRCRPGGTVAIPGMYWSALSIANPASWIMKELDLKPAIMYGHHHGIRETDTAAALLGERTEVPDAVITHRFPLADAAEAFRVAADRAAGAIKVVLEP